MAEQLHTAGARRIALDVPLVRERLQQLRHRLRRLDLELLPDLADARLIRVVAQKVEQVVIHALLDRCQWLGHAGLGQKGERDCACVSREVS
jgi:hypothetical protein